MEDTQHHTAMPIVRLRSNTVPTCSDVTIEFPWLKYQELYQRKDTGIATDIPLSPDQDESKDSSLMYGSRRSSSGLDDSLRIIKQRRDSCLRSMFLQGYSPRRRMVDNRGLGEEHSRPTILIKGRSVSTPANELRKDFDALNNSTISQNSANEEIMNLENTLTTSVDKRVTFYTEALVHDSIQQDDLDEFCDLLNKHKDINLEKPNSFGITPLHRAAIDGAYRCMNLLLSQNVNVKVRDVYGWTPLHDAVYHGNIRCAAALITAGSNVEAETNDFTKPIEMAHEDEMLLLVGRAMTSPGYVYDPDRETLV